MWNETENPAFSKNLYFWHSWRSKLSIMNSFKRSKYQIWKIISLYFWINFNFWPLEMLIFDILALQKCQKYRFWQLWYIEIHQKSNFSHVKSCLNKWKQKSSASIIQARSERGSRRLLRERSSEISKNGKGNSLSYTSAWK